MREPYGEGPASHTGPESCARDGNAGYGAVVCTLRQACLPQRFRELDKTDEADPSAPWAGFSKKLKRLLRDAIRLGKRDGLPQERYSMHAARSFFGPLLTCHLTLPPTLPASSAPVPVRGPRPPSL